MLRIQGDNKPLKKDIQRGPAAWNDRGRNKGDDNYSHQGLKVMAGPGERKQLTRSIKGGTLGTINGKGKKHLLKKRKV